MAALSQSPGCTTRTPPPGQCSFARFAEAKAASPQVPALHPEQSAARTGPSPLLRSEKGRSGESAGARRASRTARGSADTGGGDGVVVDDALREYRRRSIE